MAPILPAEVVPYNSAAAAAFYAKWSAPLTGQFVAPLLAAVGPVGAGTRLLDVATGTGVAAVAAAAAGATVFATDVAPEVLSVAAAALAPYPNATTAVMDGQALAVETGAYDVAVSVFGVFLFPNWTAGVAELVRATAPGGRVGLTTWACPNGGAFFPTLIDAYAAAFPAKTVPAVGGGVAALSTRTAVVDALTAAGCRDVTVEAVTVDWVGPRLVDAAAELIPMVHRGCFYAALTTEEREVLHASFLAHLTPYVSEEDGLIRIPSTGWVASATKAGE